jgi:hypothetical protein
MLQPFSIAILTCWYGNYPWYFPYFIHSCLYNPTIDFVIITDNKQLIVDKPENVKIIYKTLENIKHEASKKLGFAVNIDYPYKLCDFKPAYGFIFSEILTSYDFWGHGDIDIMYGDIRGFMTDEILNSYDVVNTRHEFIAGSCCLFKNNKQMNTFFMKSKDYKYVFTNAENFAFDECNFLIPELQMGGSILDFTNHIQSMTYLVKKAMLQGKIKAYFDFIIIEGMSNKIKWQRGKIIYKNQFEGMYYNLITYKQKCKNKNVLDPMPDTFYFRKEGVTASNKLLDKKILGTSIS